MNRQGRNTILVTGASGCQGGSVARHLLKDGKHNVRCLVRNPNKDSVRKLESLGGEIVRGDFEDVASLKKALEGVYAVFLVTDYWKAMGKELEQGKRMIDCCREAGIRHLIFSGLENVERLSKGKYNVPHFTMKGQLEEYIASSNIPYTFVHCAFYMQNLKIFYPLKKEQDGTLVIPIPTGNQKLGVLDIEDLGGVVKEIINRPDSYFGKTIIVCGDCLSVPEMAEIISQELRLKVKPTTMNLDQYQRSGQPAAGEMGDMFRFLNDFQPYQNSVANAKQIYPQLLSFREWVRSDPLGWKSL